MKAIKKPITILEDRQVPVQAKLAAAWTSFMFLYIYVDYFHLYKPGVVDDILVGVVFWRRATNLQGHVRAGAQVIIEALATPDLSRPLAPMHATPSTPLEQVEALLPGIGNLAAVPLVALSPAVGRTMRELNLQTLTGVTVLAILRGRAGLGFEPQPPVVSGFVAPGDVRRLALVPTRRGAVVLVANNDDAPSVFALR